MLNSTQNLRGNSQEDLEGTQKMISIDWGVLVRTVNFGSWKDSVVGSTLRAPSHYGYF